jgi:tRNA A-37 threonylcarbamoyl transferase component Bud32
MGTLDLTPSTLSSAPLAGVQPEQPLLATLAATASDCAQRTFHGLSWTYCREAGPLLARIPAGAWAAPARQDWQRVKQNARREVWRATLLGVSYYLKYHFRDRGWRRLRRLFRDTPCRAEWEGGLFARRAGIAAVRPLAYTLDVRRDGRHCALLVSEAVEPAQPLNEFWLQLCGDDDCARRRHDTAQLIERLAEMIARAHQAGFEHLDMHAANILVQPLGPRKYRTVFVDLQSARRGTPLSDHAVVRNLAQLNQWFRRHSSVGDRLRFLRAYLRWRNEFEAVFEHGRPLGLDFSGLATALTIAAERHATRLWARRDRHSARDGRYFMRLKLADGWRGLAVAACKHAADESRASQMVFDRAWWGRQLATPLDWFTQPGALCKDSHSAVVRRALLAHPQGSIPVILKRPRARNWWRRLVQSWPPSRTGRGWQMGHGLLNRDIATARPLALVERRLGPLVLDSVLVTEAIPGAIDLETFLRQQQSVLSAREWAVLKQRLAHRLAQQLRRLHERGFTHRDCKASNILVVQQPELKLLWIDMDGVRFRGRRAAASSLRPLVRLNVSLQDVAGLTRTDRVRFLKAYFARYGQSPGTWRALWPLLAADSARKARAKDQRRAWKLRHYGRP